MSSILEDLMFSHENIEYLNIYEVFFCLHQAERMLDALERNSLKMLTNKSKLIKKN